MKAAEFRFGSDEWISYLSLNVFNSLLHSCVVLPPFAAYRRVAYEDERFTFAKWDQVVDPLF